MKLTTDLPSPKRDRSSSRGRAGWYPYYAGFSADFAAAVLDSYCTERSCRVLDSWNGSGTTTSTAASRGVESFGFDLNPVMLIVARARLLNKRERTSLIPLAETALRIADNSSSLLDSDPLRSWFKAPAVSTFRRIEFGIQSLLLGSSRLKRMAQFIEKNEFSDLIAFFYVALFRTVRGLAQHFQSSNPTWIKIPNAPEDCLSPGEKEIRSAFLHNVQQMEQLLDADHIDKDGKVKIGIASSLNLPIPSNSIDFVLTSPPYCTRIDYAAATRVELAVLGVDNGEAFDTLRRQLIGSPTVPKATPSYAPEWGAACGSVLEAVKGHRSRASAGYYHKGLSQYFQSIHCSIQELHRCLKPEGHACLVLQDSFYKEVYIDLATICAEMASQIGMRLRERQNFAQTRNLAQVNAKSKIYRATSPAIESVLILTKL